MSEVSDNGDLNGQDAGSKIDNQGVILQDTHPIGQPETTPFLSTGSHPRGSLQVVTRLIGGLITSPDILASVLILADSAERLVRRAAWGGKLHRFYGSNLLVALCVILLIDPPSKIVKYAGLSEDAVNNTLAVRREIAARGQTLSSETITDSYRGSFNLCVVLDKLEQSTKLPFQPSISQSHNPALNMSLIANCCFHEGQELALSALDTSLLDDSTTLATRAIQTCFALMDTLIRMNDIETSSDLVLLLTLAQQVAQLFTSNKETRNSSLYNAEGIQHAILSTTRVFVRSLKSIPGNDSIAVLDVAIISFHGADNSLAVHALELVTSRGVAVSLSQVLPNSFSDPLDIYGDGMNTIANVQFAVPLAWLSPSSPLGLFAVRIHGLDLPGVPIDLTSFCGSAQAATLDALSTPLPLSSPFLASPVSLTELLAALPTRLPAVSTVVLPFYLRTSQPSPASSALPPKLETTSIQVALIPADLPPVVAGEKTGSIPSGIVLPTTLRLVLPAVFQDILTSPHAHGEISSRAQLHDPLDPPYDIRISIYDSDTHQPSLNKRPSQLSCLPPSLWPALPSPAPPVSFAIATTGPDAPPLSLAAAGITFCLSNPEAGLPFWMDTHADANNKNKCVELHIPLYLLAMREGPSAHFVEFDVSHQGKHLMTYVSSPISLFAVSPVNVSVKKPLPVSPTPLDIPPQEFHSFVSPSTTYLLAVSLASLPFTSVSSIDVAFVGCGPLNLNTEDLNKIRFHSLAPLNSTPLLVPVTTATLASSHVWIATPSKKLPENWIQKLNKETGTLLKDVTSRLITQTTRELLNANGIAAAVQHAPFLCRVSAPKTAKVGDCLEIEVGIFNRTAVPQKVHVWLDMGIPNATTMVMQKSPPPSRPLSLVGSGGSHLNVSSQFMVAGLTSTSFMIAPAEAKEWKMQVICVAPGEGTLPLVYYCTNRNAAVGLTGEIAAVEGMLIAHQPQIGPVVEISVLPK